MSGMHVRTGGIFNERPKEGVTITGKEVGWTKPIVSHLYDDQTAGHVVRLVRLTISV
jgi:hypothetical protein